MAQVILKLFLRLAIGCSFLSAVADRLGYWHSHVAWGNWKSFTDYVAVLNPWFPQIFIPAIAYIATTAELLFAVCLLIGFKTTLFAKLSGWLLLLFAVSMTFTTGIKTAFDASVFTASGAAFALGFMKNQFWELDSFIAHHQRKSY